MSQHWLNLDGYLGRVQFGAGRTPIAGTDWRHMPGELMAKTNVDNNRGRGLVIQASLHEFYLVGANYRLFLRRKFTGNKQSPVSHDDMTGRQLRVEEGHFDRNGEFIVDRKRNGDNISSGLWVVPDIGVLRVITCD